MKKLVFLILIYFVLPISAQPQSQSFYYTYIDSLIFRPKFNLVAHGKLVNFLFPPLEVGDSYSEKNLSSVKIKEEGISKYGCSFKITGGYILDPKQYIKLKFYSIGIDTLHIAIKFHNQNKKRLASIVLDKKRKYFNYSFSIKELVNNNYKLYNNSVEKLFIEYDEVKGRCQDFIINDLYVYIPVEVIGTTPKELEQAMHCKAYILLHNNNFPEFCDDITPKNISCFDETNKLFFLKYPVKRKFQLSHNALAIISLQDVSKTVHEILTEYFNKTEKSNDRDLLSEYYKIEQTASDLDDYYKKLQQYLLTLHDNHFRLINDYSDSLHRVRTPLYFYEINNDIIVSGIYDSGLLKTVTLGDKLLSVDNISIMELLDTISTNINGSTFHNRRFKAIQKILCYYCYIKESNDSIITLRFQKENGKQYLLTLTKEEVFNNKHIKLPNNILKNIERYQFRKIQGFGYLKIGRFENDRFRPFFYSILDSLMESKGLIIDLRNNPGGDMCSAFLYSFFINKPEIFFTSQNLNYQFETLVVNPDPFYYYNKPVVILFNSGTTCSAEVFLRGMQSSKDDFTSISNSKSAGAVQEVINFTLPPTKLFKPRLAYRNNVFLDAKNINIDNIGGIEPKIWIAFNSYFDLAPYDDKLLESAVKWLKNYNKASPELMQKNNTLFIISICIVIVVTILLTIIYYRKI